MRFKLYHARSSEPLQLETLQTLEMPMPQPGGINTSNLERINRQNVGTLDYDFLKSSEV